MLSCQELACLENESSGNEDIVMYVWAYYETDLGTKIFVTGGSGLRNGQDEGGKTEMVSACEEEMNRCSSEEA